VTNLQPDGNSWKLCLIGGCAITDGICFNCGARASLAGGVVPAGDEQKSSVLQYPEVDVFAGRMRAEMIANAHKGDNWRGMTPRQAWGEISWHLGKLTVAIKTEDVSAIRELTADIANGAMMLDQIVCIFDKPAPVVIKRSQLHD